MYRKIIYLLMLFVVFGCSSGSDPFVENDEQNEKLDVTVTLISPNVLNNGVKASFSATFSAPINEAVFYFDGKSIGSVISSPYSVDFTPVDVKPGVYLVTCIAKVGTKTYSGEMSVKVELRLGDMFQGGRIFKLDASGKSGLIASVSDLSYSSTFGNEVRFVWGLDILLGTTLDDGKKNTKLMSAVAPSAGYAAYHFKGDGLSLNGFSDWYIPSYRELELLKENKNLVGGFSTATDWQAIYWSSSELNETMAFQLNFNALMGNSNDKSKAFKVRPIRSFDFN